MSETSSLRRNHQIWIGNLQPVGLLISAPVLEAAQVPIDLNPIALHRDFLSLLPRDRRNEPVPELPSFRDFAERILGWPPELWISPAPDNTRAFLETYREQLEPDAVLIEPRDNSVILLVSNVPNGVNFDDPPPEKTRNWNASPHARFERLLRETGHPIGILAGPEAVRLVYAPKGESTAWATFRVEHMAAVQGRMLLGALQALLGYERLLTGPVGERLLGILRRSRDYQNDVSNELAEQVLEALYALLRGFQAADDFSNGKLLRETLDTDPGLAYNGLLTVLMRLVFLLYAEDKGLMPQDPVYLEHYSVSRLFNQLQHDKDQFPTEMSRRYGAWARLLALFGLIWTGGRHGRLTVPARHGYLFDPGRYPFLAKKDAAGELPHVPDGTVLEVLRNLLILQKERISYRALDVEQIGSVYEAIMGFELHKATGPSRAIKSSKRHGPPVTINLETLLTKSSDNRAKWLKSETGIELAAEAAKLLKSAKSLEDLEAALQKRIHDKVTPERVRKGAMILQPSLERRRSGSHYTPRSLTRPIVETTLEPLFKAMGSDPSPEQILQLKVCDPAMGSGAFLVEASRQLGAALVEAWQRRGERPPLPLDEDEILYAQRLVVQRCIYGVDKNRMAVDLAKLSLWLATLARDHAFTFIDHNLRHGDSLVGLTVRQIASVSWEEGQRALYLDEELRRRLAGAVRERNEILAADDAQPYDQLRARLDSADQNLDVIRTIGDAVCATWLRNETPKAKAAALRNLQYLLSQYLTANDLEAGGQIDAEIRAMRSTDKPIVPFHWEIEFPEVFQLDSEQRSHGFDAIVGNPPFAGKNTLAEGTVKTYPKWLQQIHEESHGNADLVAHFFRRAFSLLRPNGCFGLIATNTIGQGDTRSSGLGWIRKHGGTIYCARKRQPWPGEATVVVSIVHVHKGIFIGPFTLNSRDVTGISAYLFHRGGDNDPSKLRYNERKSFIGTYVCGMGFTFDDSDRKGVASSLADMAALAASPSNRTRIFPFLGGEEINSHPEHQPDRYVINFENFPLRRTQLGSTWQKASVERRRVWLQIGLVPTDYPGPVAADWADLLQIVEKRVKPARTTDKRDRYREQWWKFAEHRPGLYKSIRNLASTLVINCGACPHLALARVPVSSVFSNTVAVIALESFSAFAVLQSSIHEIWVRMMTSTLEDRLRYAPSDCFETFPFPPNYESNPSLEQAGREYYEYRAELMRKTGKGLTKTYNRFHDKYDQAADIHKLRALHDAMDRAVLDAYNWQDLSPTPDHEREFGEALAADPDANEASALPVSGKGRRGAGRKPAKEKYRRRWPEEDRDEILFRLLTLNEQYAKEAPTFASAGASPAHPALEGGDDAELAQELDEDAEEQEGDETDEDEE
ncbi:MAG: DNA methyltransferase [Bryobacteraceae bacterium]|nr:DNA methyltransferase [Bryobacteraceae bacterium]